MSAYGYSGRIKSIISQIEGTDEGDTKTKKSTVIHREKQPAARFSILYKLTILTVLVIITVISVVVGVVIQKEKKTGYAVMEEKAVIIAYGLARSVLDFLIDPDFYSSTMRRREVIGFNIAPAFQENALTSGIMYIKLYDKNNQIVYSCGQIDQSVRSVPRFTVDLRTSSKKYQFSKYHIQKNTEEVSFVTALNNFADDIKRDGISETGFRKLLYTILNLEDNLYNIAYPVMPADARRHTGLIHIGVSQKNSNNQIVEIVADILKMAFFALIFGIILALIFAVLFTHPIRKVTASLIAVSKGNLDQYIRHKSRDEIGVLTWNFNYMTAELREKEKMRDRFGKAVSEEIMDVMMSGSLELGGEDKNVTMLFSDIRGFTALAGNQTPGEVLKMLNDYFTLMEDIVKKNMGVIDKYVGDEIMAIFGAVSENQDSAENACRTAVEMILALEELNTSRENEQKPPIRIGIGINSGVVTAGMLGSRNRMNYTVIGDTVNMASRLCDAAGTRGTNPIVIAEGTYQQVKDFVLVRSGTLLAVKGKNVPVPVYELIGVIAREKSNQVKLGISNAETVRTDGKEGEARQYERLTVTKKIDAFFRQINSNKNHGITEFADFSYSGLKFLSARSAAIGEYIELKMHMDDYLIRFIVQCRRCKEVSPEVFDFGCQFVTISGHDLRLLASLFIQMPEKQKQ